MQEGTIPFSEVQALYELCTFSTDLKKFCKDIGVSYDGYVKWRQRLRYDETIGKTVETEPPAASLMSEVDIVGSPGLDGTADIDIDEGDSNVGQTDPPDTDVKDTPQKDGLPDSTEPHSETTADGVPTLKGFDLRTTTLADVICAGRGLDMQIDSFKLHMHDGLNMRHTHITLRQAITILHQLNIMYSC